MATFNRIDIVEAHYLFLTHFHEGGGSKKYQRLSTIPTRFGFKPAPNLSYDTLTENGRDIYDALVRKELQAIGTMHTSDYEDLLADQGWYVRETIDGDWTYYLGTDGITDDNPRFDSHFEALNALRQVLRDPVKLTN